MKTITKLFFITAFSFAAMTASAQWWNGGDQDYTGGGGQPYITMGTPFLHLRATGTSNRGIVLRKNTTTGTGWFWQDGSDVIRISNSTGGGTPHIAIPTSGLVGLNTAAPAEELHIVGASTTADIRLESSGSKYLRFYEGSTQKAYVGHTGTSMIMQNDETNGEIEIDGQTGVTLRVNNNTALDVDDAGLITIDKTSEALRLSGSSSYMSFYNGATYNGYLWHNNTNMYLNNNTATGNMYFGTGAGGTDMTINSSGDVGIGTTSPESKLHVHKGAGTYTGTAGSIANIYVEDDGFNTIMMNGGNTFNGLVFSDEGNSQRAGLYYNKSSNILMLKNSGDNRIAITDAGDVGIGAGTNPQERLHVAGGLILNEGTTTRVTGSSATQLVERTDGAAMLFGAGNNAGFTIDENFDFQVRSRPRANVLARSLSGGLYLYVADGNNGNSAMGYSNATAATHRLRVNGSVQATSYAIVSDRKLKNNVNAFEVGLDAVKKLNPVTYQYNGDLGIETDAIQVGIMAQDLQKVAPVLVNEETYYETSELTGKAEAKDSYLSINDTGVKYMLINAVKELSADVDAKDERIEALESELASMKDAIAQIQAQLANNATTTKVNPTLTERDVTLNGDTKVAELDQNHPNPFNENTTITYFLPEGTTGAHMNIFSAEGKVLKTVKIDEAGQGQINLRANSLPAGNYMYQLVTDAGVIGSKSMVIAK